MTKIDGIFEGGGTLGSAYIGSLRALEDNDIWFKTVAGNSAGAITAALVAVGYSAKELHWLTSNRTIDKPNFFNRRNIEEIDFESFLDFPTKASNISTFNKKRTILWKVLKGEVIDIIRNMKIDGFPTRDRTSRKIAKDIIKIPLMPDKFENDIYNIVHGVLILLPNQTPKIKDFIPFNTTLLREQLANEIWDRIVDNISLYPISVNLIYEGGLCEGDKFLNTMRKLLKEKSSLDDVTFKDLMIPLVLIASDTKHKKMLVYSAKTTPRKSVAEAVRESMSIPFVFEPMGRDEIVDGGLCSNYPYWVYAEGISGKYFDLSDIDNTRIKIGFKLDEAGIIDSSWDILGAKYTENGRASSPRTIDVLYELLRYKGILSGTSTLDIDIDFLKNFSFLTNVMEAGSVNYLHKIFSKKIMEDTTFYEVSIPIKGYHWLDFLISKNNNHFKSIIQRGWYATIKMLDEQSLLINNTACPYNGDTDSSRIDASILHPNGKAYFFKGSQYKRFDFNTGRVDHTARIDIDGWNGLWKEGIDASILHPNGKAYFFKGSQYKRFDFNTGRVDHTARIDIDGWNGLWKEGIDASILHPNGKAYFFKGSQYKRFDFNIGRVDHTARIDIDGWNGLWR